MQAFINTTHTKESAVALAKWHQEQDDYIKGMYGNPTPDGWKGCSVGCMAKGKHGDYPALFGIDTRVAYLSDRFFENLDDYKNWTVRFFESVKKSSDTTLAYYRFMLWMLMDADRGVVKHNQHKSIFAVEALFERAMDGDLPDEDEWRAASYASADAAAASYASADAAAAASYAAAAAAASYAAASYAAAAAADAAAAAAADASYAAAAAAAAARKKHYKIMADKLCYFLSGGV